MQELSVGEASARYDAITTRHAHVVCSCCGKVADLSHDPFGELRHKATPFTDFTLESEQLIFYGKCPECQKEKC